MKLYTNKFPITTSYPCIQPDGALDKATPIPISFEEGCIFKVVCMGQDVLFLECKGKTIVVRAEMLSIGFVETEVDI